jgi:hypothetical protein
MKEEKKDEKKKLTAEELENATGGTVVSLNRLAKD